MTEMTTVAAHDDPARRRQFAHHARSLAATAVLDPAASRRSP
jgi:hypothetical protein